LIVCVTRSDDQSFSVKDDAGSRGSSSDVSFDVDTAAVKPEAVTRLSEVLMIFVGAVIPRAMCLDG